MNMIVLFNSFMDLIESHEKPVPPIQVALYFKLVHIFNKRYWENPTHISNGLICASLHISEKSLIEARKGLAELGVIEFENGIKNVRSPKYYLIDYCNKVSNKGGNEGGNNGSNQGGNSAGNNVGNEDSNRGGRQGNTLNKQNRNQTKLNKTKQSIGDTRSPDEKIVSGNWNLWVESWFSFYKEKNNSVSPSFGGSQAKALKDIRIFLEKNFQEKYPDQDCAAGALDTWKHILQNHHKLHAWLQGQFDLTVIHKKINDIINQVMHASGSRRVGENGGKSAREQVQERLKARFSAADSSKPGYVRVAV